jgi:nitrogen fixation NifU-like protein
MSDDLRDLYQEVILDHNKRPRNYGEMAHASHSSKGHNPLCGDRLTLFLPVYADRIADVSFVGSGCAISKASASLMTDAVRGKSLDEASALFDHVQRMVTAPMDAPVEDEALGKLAVLGGVREFPSRVKCASLAWHTLRAALEQSPRPASTDGDR